MKTFVTLCVVALMLAAKPVVAMTDGEVTYVGGTVSTMKAGATGAFDMSSPTTLKFTSGNTSLEIPFAKIVSYNYSQEVARHLGVLPAIGVALVKKRQKRHFIRIIFHDDSGAVEVTVFEVPKQMPQTLLPILQARVPQPCKPHNSSNCEPGAVATKISHGAV